MLSITDVVAHSENDVYLQQYSNTFFFFLQIHSLLEYIIYCF